MNDSNDSYPASEYESLAKEEAPPRVFERRIVAALKKEKLLKETNRMQFLKIAAVLAVCAIFFAFGAMFEKTKSTGNSSGVSMSDKTFVLFLIEDGSYRNATNKTEQEERIELYRSWAAGLRKRGVPITGTKLHDEAHFLNQAPQKGAAGSGIAGYFLIDASNFEEALRISQSCPHLRFGGRIEVRRVQPV